MLISKRMGWNLGLALTLALTTLTACAAKAAPVANDGAALTAVVDSYGAVHAALFADDLAKAQAAAKELAAAAVGQADLARAATALASAADLPAARSAFGDASKALITLLAANPDAAKGLFTFRCPMTKTYQKWIQRVDIVQNPYMGQHMPHCGSHVAMAP